MQGIFNVGQSCIWLTEAYNVHEGCIVYVEQILVRVNIYDVTNIKTE